MDGGPTTYGWQRRLRGNVSEEQIRLPLVVDHPAEILDKSYMRRFSRCPCQLHTRLVGSSVAFPVIASDTCTHEVLPCIATATGFRHDVIYCQRWSGCTTILAAAVIAPDNIPPGQLDLFIREMDVCTQPNDAGIRKAGGNRVNASLFPFGNKLGLGKQKQYNCPFYIAHTDRFIALVQDQDPAAKTGMGGVFGGKGHLNGASSRR